MRKLIWLIVIAVGVAAYHNSFHGPFIFDDISAIRDNSHIRQLWALGKALSAPPQTTAAGRPVLALSLAMNYAISGLDVWSYHAFNLAIHIGAALVLYGVVRLTLESARLHERFGPDAWWLALAVALIWMLHPLQTGSVTYIAQRAESLMGLFYLLTLYCAIRGWQVAAILSCVLGMTAKETMVTAPLAVLLYDWVFTPGTFRDVLRARWKLYAGLGSTWLVLGALMATASRTESVGFGLENVSAWDYARTQCAVVSHYLCLAVWPQPLVLDYYWPVTKSWDDIGSAAFLLAALAGGVVWSLRRKSGLGFLGVWFFLVLAPTSSFVPIVTEIAAEHRMYLPLVAVVALLVIGVAQIRRDACVTVLCLLAVVLGLLTVQRNEEYRTELSIWSDTVAKRPQNPRAHNNLGQALINRGKLDAGIEEFREAVRLEPNFAAAHSNLGRSLFVQNKFAEAATHFSEALRVKPDVPLRVELGMALGEIGQNEEAVEQFREALQRDPLLVDAYYNLGVALARQGKLDEALHNFEQAVELDPNLAIARQARDDLCARIAPTAADTKDKQRTKDDQTAVQ